MNKETTNNITQLNELGYVKLKDGEWRREKLNGRIIFCNKELDEYIFIQKNKVFKHAGGFEVTELTISELNAIYNYLNKSLPLNKDIEEATNRQLIFDNQQATINQLLSRIENLKDELNTIKRVLAKSEDYRKAWEHHYNLCKELEESLDRTNYQLSIAFEQITESDNKLNAIKDIVEEMEHTEYTDCEMLYDDIIKIKEVLDK